TSTGSTAAARKSRSRQAPESRPHGRRSTSPATPSTSSRPPSSTAQHSPTRRSSSHDNSTPSAHPQPHHSRARLPPDLPARLTRCTPWRSQAYAPQTTQNSSASTGSRADQYAKHSTLPAPPTGI